MIGRKIVRQEDAPKLETVKGRHGVILVVGERAIMMKLTVEPGIPTPLHSTPTSRWATLSRVRAPSTSGTSPPASRPGPPSGFPTNTPHNFDATGDKPAILVEAFASPKEDYLERVK